jgi:hypothetical protein
MNESEKMEHWTWAQAEEIRLLKDEIAQFAHRDRRALILPGEKK